MGRPISLVRRGYGWVVPMYQTHHANLPGGVDCDEYPREFRASAASDAGTEKSRAPARHRCVLATRIAHYTDVNLCKLCCSIRSVGLSIVMASKKANGAHAP